GLVVAIRLLLRAVLDIRLHARDPEPVIVALAFTRHDPGQHVLVVVLGVHAQTQADLLAVGEAGRATRLLPRLCEHREEDGGEDCNYSNNHEQLDEGEAATNRLLRLFHRYPPSLPVGSGRRPTAADVTRAGIRYGRGFPPGWFRLA